MPLLPGICHESSVFYSGHVSGEHLSFDRRNRSDSAILDTGESDELIHRLKDLDPPPIKMILLTHPVSTMQGL